MGSLELLRSPACQAQIQAIGRAQRQGLFLLAHHTIPVLKPRWLGTLCAFDMECVKTAAALQAHCLKAGFLICPLGNTVYTLPPYVITAEELMAFYEHFAHLAKA